MRNPVAGLNRKNIKELTDRKKRWDFDQAAKAAREKYGQEKQRTAKPKKQKQLPAAGDDNVRQHEINALEAIIADPKAKTSAKLKARKRLAELLK